MSRRLSPNDTKTTAPNTNLEQISDWLTKIIVGVGLTQFPQIIRGFQSLGIRWGSAFGPGAAGELIAISITVHYLITRSSNCGSLEILNLFTRCGWMS